jgi:uncharacterized protein YndB with AHSA1/START domain
MEDKKGKIHCEYTLNSTSKNILWTAISTPSGMESWFADRVTAEDLDRIFIFRWGKDETRHAELISSRVFSFIRFRWLDDEDEHNYFELKINTNELTNDMVLEITDFAEPGEEQDLRELWETQIDRLRRTCGF